MTWTKKPFLSHQFSIQRLPTMVAQILFVPRLQGQGHHPSLVLRQILQTSLHDNTKVLPYTTLIKSSVSFPKRTLSFCL